MEFEPTLTPTPEKEENRETKKEKVQKICRQIEQEDPSYKIHAENADEFIQTIENLPEYQEYLDQKVTIDTFKKIISEIEEETKKRDDEDLEYIVDFLRGEAETIEEKTREYYEIINSIENGSKTAKFLGSEKLKKWTETKDKKRRICHNSIVSSLGIFKRFLNEKLSEDFNINIDVDFFNEDELPSGLLENINDHEKLSGDEKKSRQKIGEWAFSTGLGEKLRDYREIAKEIKKRSA